MLHLSGKSGDFTTRRSFIGGSDARIIMGYDEAALIRLWREKRGEADHEDDRQDYGRLHADAP